ncbi:MAG TPA: GntR family transcriptional regulator [Enteractinococcus helveticum]|uniref:GntR family transcriptional regulator n=1 Tax=Enteractinococcus helveticum TaxID=1837282 RepID=A0A921FM69_9MICC|nr:GntR family transcriptional regulator [Enteractinococcus helveticum]HJF14011.1 GntR family transcriptional regulator [Enteractinococcus helveticum]
MISNGLSKADQAHQHVLNGITTGQYKPGDRLVLSSIANELGMSVVPVREAIRRLQTDNLVTFERNVGATVTGIDPIEYQYTMETLALVEGYSTAQCAPLVTVQTLTKARGINQQMREMLNEDFAPEMFTALNEKLHLALFEHHPNPHILDLVHRGWNRLAALRSSIFSFVPARAADSVVEHDELLDLIADGAEFSVIEAAARKHRLNAMHAYLDHHAKANPKDF